MLGHNPPVVATRWLGKISASLHIGRWQPASWFPAHRCGQRPALSAGAMPNREIAFQKLETAPARRQADLIFRNPRPTTTRSYQPDYLLDRPSKFAPSH